MTVKGCDSWWSPSAAQIATAKANSVSCWAGYFSDGHDGIYGGGWSDATFQLVKDGGLQTLAFCSYRADAATWKARAESLGIVLVLDVERSVDGGDGPEVDPWLAASGARLYGCGPGAGVPNVMTTHLMHGHSGYQVADYRSIPGSGSLSWPAQPRPGAMPTAWQYQGTAPHPWGNTDLGIYDEAFISPGEVMTAAQAAMLQQIFDALFGPYENSPTVGAPWNNVEILRRMLADLGAPFNPSQAVPFVATPVAPGSGLTADQAAALAAIPGLVATVARIETALKGA